MTHSDSRIWIHLVWATKYRERLLFAEVGKPLFRFMINKAKEEGIPFERLNIQPEHVHGLINLPTDKCVADFMKTIKGSSSYWFNQQKFLNTHFAWQRGFGAYSVSATVFDTVSDYIKYQSQHHQTQDFQEEYDEWKRKYGLFDDEEE